MDDVWFEGVRCFRDKTAVPVRPLTVLVGENSTGKSTVLAMIRAAWDVSNQPWTPDFTEEPFDLGAYDSIAHHHGGQGKRVDHFTIAANISEGARKQGVQAVFRHRDGQPDLREWKTSAAGASISAVIGDDDQLSVLITVGKKSYKIDVEGGSGPRSFDQERALARAFFVVEEALFAGPHRLAGRPDLSRHQSALVQLLPFRMRHYGSRPYAGAPIRSEPQRTYNPKRSAPQPHGQHVPMRLASLRRTSPKEFEQLVGELRSFGESAGLFKKLDVKPLGQKASDPFQIVVGVEKFTFNLADVGYGVSQVLPILFDTLSQPQPRIFLLQQPEVHLHPRAQAELGSFLVRQAKRHGHKFVIETHSDYLLDRIRMELRRTQASARLEPKDVSVLYFERVAGSVRRHQLALDEQGNLTNAPAGYRQFFLDEERNLLGLS